MRQVFICLSMLMLPATAMAEVELSFYGGLQSAQPSDVTTFGETNNVVWEGKSFDAPPYYGIRATIWSSSASRNNCSTLGSSALSSVFGCTPTEAETLS